MTPEEQQIIGWWLRNFDKVSESQKNRIKAAVCSEISDLTNFELSMILFFLRSVKKLVVIPGFEILKEEYDHANVTE